MSAVVKDGPALALDEFHGELNPMHLDASGNPHFTNHSALGHAEIGSRSGEINSKELVSEGASSGFITKELIQGNLKIGEVFYYGQLHIAGHIELLPWEIERISNIQEKILRDLIKREISQIVTEGRVETSSTTHPYRELQIHTAEFKLAFPERVLPEVLNFEQQRFLAIRGAEEALANLRPHVTLLRAWTPLVESLYFEFAQVNERGKPLHPSSEVEHWRMFLRERAAAGEVLQFLTSGNEGSRVAIIFGARHSFDKRVFSALDLPDELLPRVISLKVEDRLETPAEALKNLEGTCDEASELREIQNARYIEGGIPHGYLSEENFRAALPKLVVDPTRVSSPEVIFRRYQEFLAYNSWAGSLELIDHLNGMMQINSGLFRSLVPSRPVDIEVISLLSPLEIHHRIADSRDIPEQNLVVRHANAILIPSLSYIQSEAGQVEALNKLVTGEDPPSDSQLLKELANRLTFEKPRRQLITHHRERTGPFAGR